jgi:hypothetical protein
VSITLRLAPYLAPGTVDDSIAVHDTRFMMVEETAGTIDRTEIDSGAPSVYDLMPSPLSEQFMADADSIKPEPKLSGLAGWAVDRLGIHPWGQVLIVLLLIVGGGLVTWLRSVDGHLTQIDTKIEVMPLQISRDLLSQAKADVTTGALDRAIQATGAVSALISQATVRRLPAKPDYFLGAVADLNIIRNASDSSNWPEKPKLIERVATTRVVLANYRSALEAPPAPSKKDASLEESYSVKQKSTVDQATFNAVTIKAPPVQQFFVSPFVRRLSDEIVIEYLNFDGGIQVIDGIHWGHVVFLNTLVKYEGGELELNNVRFINCTFQLDDGVRGRRVADYVALGQSQLLIGPEAAK